MPITKSSFARTTALFLVVGLAVLIVIVGMSVWLVQRTQVYFDEVIEARDARAATVDLRSLLQDAQTGQRGFLLTLDESYLEPYEAARDRIMPQYEVMRRVLAPYPQGNLPMADLETALTEKLAELEETIELARQGRSEEALQIVLTDRGKALMDEARVLFDAVVRAADERLSEGVADQRASATALTWVTVIGAIIIVGVVVGSVWVATGYTRELVSARAEVESLNQGLEEHVEERTRQLRRANEEVQHFAYIVTHDLRAPLVNIMGFTSEMETGLAALQAYVAEDGNPREEHIREEAKLAAGEELPEAIGFIRSSTKKMDGLINAILKLSREGRRPLKPQNVDLAALVELSADSVRHQVNEAGGEIAVDIDVPSLVSDRLALEQVIGNLLDNAVKYRAPGRPLEIAVRARATPGRRIAIDVSDNGRGIAPQDHERVFELFRRSGAQDQPGEGIGLPYVRTLVRSLGGEVTLSSEPGKGTTFHITMPRDLRGAERSIAA